jgi:hypothetical protein
MDCNPSGVGEQIISLRKKVEWNTRILTVSWIAFISFALCGFQSSESTPQTLRVRSLRIVDEHGADVMRLESVNGNPIIQMKTANLATTLESGKISLDSKDANEKRSNSTIDFTEGFPRMLMALPEGKQALAFGFDKTRPAIVMSDRTSDQFNTLESGAVVLQNGSASRKIMIALGDQAGPAIRLIDAEEHSDRLGVFTSAGFGSKVDGASTELRTVDGVQTMKLSSADAKNSISFAVDKETASAKGAKQGKSFTWLSKADD